MTLALVIDASVGLKWVSPEPDSHLAEALARGDEELLVPDFWLNEATNVLWLQVRKRVFTPDEARRGLSLIEAQVEPTRTADMGLYGIALDIGIATNHSTYDTLYVAFAVAVGARAVVMADGPLARAIRGHPSGDIARLALLLDEWGRSPSPTRGKAG